jgi:hypothetical protein
MNKWKNSVPHRVPGNPPPPQLSFEASHAYYRKLLAEMDQVEDLTRKKVLFRQLSSLLDMMETAFGPQGARS